MLDELHNINIENKEQYITAFKDLLKQIQTNTFSFQDQQHEHYDIINKTKLNSHFVHIVPKETLELFRKLQTQHPEAFLGLTILAGKHQDKDIRLSCFGIPCHKLIKAITT
tara:strand:+ start:166 stop:498 length:333 start_codon:yes stop_codon:yes gene_type:complete